MIWKIAAGLLVLTLLGVSWQQDKTVRSQRDLIRRITLDCPVPGSGPTPEPEGKKVPENKPEPSSQSEVPESPYCTDYTGQWNPKCLHQI